MVESVLENTELEVAVMVRPSSESFYYDRHYLDVMKKDVELLQKAGVKRVVLGMLDENGNIDVDALDYVLENVDKMGVTFHRAIDSSNDAVESVKVLNKCEKVTHILTSGGPGKAVDNIDTIRKMVEISRPKIMIGSGLNLDAIDFIKSEIDDEKFDYDIHFGTYVQDENKIVDIEKVKELVERF